MRKSRLALIALVVVLAGMLVPTNAFAASAAEAEKCAVELVEKLAQREITESEYQHEAIDCFSAPSPVVPAWNEVLWGSLAFAVVAAGLIKFGFPAVKKGLQAREDKIREDLAAAENAKQEALSKAQDYDAKLADARNEASRIIDEAKTQAGEVKADLIAKAEEEAAMVRAKAQADADQITTRALSDIESQVASLSIDLAEKVVKKSLDKEAQLELVNSYIAELK